MYNHPAAAAINRRGSADSAATTDSDSTLTSDEEDEDTPSATPLPSSTFLRRGNQREQVQERKRLERLVLEDLDLGFDYRSSELEPLPRGGLRRQVRLDPRFSSLHSSNTHLLSERNINLHIAVH